MYYEWRLGLVALSFTPLILFSVFFQQRQMLIENQSENETLKKSTKVTQNQTDFLTKYYLLFLFLSLQ